MRTLEQKLTYENLELIARPSSLPPSAAKPATFKRALTFFRHLASTAMHQLTHSHEPRIWASTIKSGPNAGQTLWHLHDPLTQHRATLASEAEVRTWLETRYYRSNHS